ncbi:putative ubiquitin carboxyl-terminal hydrolase CYLD isoform 2 [Scophthalmus maximus]|uniref:Glutathione hydrolase n=1 Tax=Scophthalmus maximus TaxID=52904 RepID=A0A2U9BIF8_SCOMX|nr:putative ubiquitin carboxyl-terminal hydrolase CYLD isoform 2 [Scophthalmus maximus]
MAVSPETKLNKPSTYHHLPKEIPLKEMVSGGPNLFDQNLSNLKDTDKEHSSQDSLLPLCTVSIIFAIGVTVALILHLKLGERLVYVKGVLVSDHELCTELGQKVLQDCGSSVDAAIAATLCLGVVHPHVSGVGGGGVMMVHDISRNETRVIDFQGAAPKTLTEEMLRNASELEAGLQVGVPGMLRGLHHAHHLYGSLLWDDVVTRAAAVAKEGFNVSLSLAEAISKVKGEHLPQRFLDMFFPGGQALRAGSFLRMPVLAGVLEAGLSNGYSGNFTQDIVDEVRANGGVLSREDIYNYTVEVEQPVEGLYNEFIIQVPPPPSAGAALISALSLLQGFHLNENNNTENQTYHWIDEALKGALAAASGLADPQYNSSVTELPLDMLRTRHVEVLRQSFSHSHKMLPEQTELQAGRVVVMGPDDLMVTVASSLSRPFGSRLITRSGVLLNSLVLDFSWPNKTRGHFQTNPRNEVQPGKRPLSFLMPTIVVPAWNKCGIYMALSSSGGQESLSAITQLLIDALTNHGEKNVSLSLKRLHPPSRLLVDCNVTTSTGGSCCALRGTTRRSPPQSYQGGVGVASPGRVGVARHTLGISVLNPLTSSRLCHRGEEEEPRRASSHPPRAELTPMMRVNRGVLGHSAAARCLPTQVEDVGSLLGHSGGHAFPNFSNEVPCARSKCNRTLLSSGRFRTIWQTPLPETRGRPMEAKTAAKEKFFVVLRGKSRKGFCRGCVGRAQLLLFVPSASRRLELLCNPQLFSAVCALTQDDLVVVRHKKGHLPGMVRNLMQIGRKENKDDLHMLGFEVEFVDNDNNLSSKKPAPLPLFSAADIVQVVPSYSVPLGLHWRDSQCGGPNIKTVTRINSMPNIGSRARQEREKHAEQNAAPSQSPSTSRVPLEVGSMVEVVSNSGITVYGVVRWLGVLAGKSDEWAGIELDYEVNGCSDGKYGSQRYFTCKGSRALFVPVTKCSPDSRFVYSSTGRETPRPTETPPVPPFEDLEEDASPIPESDALSLLVGRMKGIQGHINSCYLDATLFSLFSTSVTLDHICQKPADTEQPITCTLRKIVNRLRRQGFVPAESVMNFRKQLGCDTFQTEEKDPEEFITVLFQKVLCMEPLLKLRSRRETSQGAYTFQIFLEKEQMGQMPTVQQLLDTSCLSGDLKFEEVSVAH